MGTAGIIFGVIAVAWIAYLVPSAINRRNDIEVDQLEINQRFNESMKIVQRRARNESESDDPYLEISTPLTRKAAMAEIRLAHKTAANRRIRGTFSLLVLIVGIAIASIFVSALPWWSFLVPTGLLIPWLALCRFNTRTLTAELDARARAIRNGWAEQTVAISLPINQVAGEPDGSHEFSIEFSEPITDMGGSLWESIPITPTTYVSKPLAPRTVRTIDLSAPVLSESTLPPTAEAQEHSESSEESQAEAV